ncbi:17165_t:CDS:2 [Acaulospora morrowiae]|uniref:17165_t:CDS:1 n=1 Tax=Acaulospora morrowiae TaxID=94023 RepID=A0A9N9A646_9GLOM|nr:17165_t:CDS:2 [Acaulospora morrowiae]
MVSQFPISGLLRQEKGTTIPKRFWFAFRSVGYPELMKAPNEA